MVESRPLYPYPSVAGCLLCDEGYPFANHNDPGRPVHKVYERGYGCDSATLTAKSSSLLDPCSASEQPVETAKALFYPHPFHHDENPGIYRHDVGNSHYCVLKGFGAEEASYSCDGGCPLEDLTTAFCVRGCTTGGGNGNDCAQSRNPNLNPRSQRNPSHYRMTRTPS